MPACHKFPHPLSERVVLIRSGGLGDFILSLPLLRALQSIYPSCTLVSYASYLGLIASDFPALLTADIDSFSLASDRSRGWSNCFNQAVVLSFLPDRDGSLRKHVLSLGAVRYLQLQSRPVSPPQFCLHTFRDAGMQVPADWYLPMLRAKPPPAGAQSLWLHVGSGSRDKNAPLDWFRNLVRFICPDKLILSFGEADMGLVEPASRAFREWSPKLVCSPTLVQLRQQLSGQAASFVGNDSGVTHLAAALNIPVTAVFTKTNPEIWAPQTPGTAIAQVGRAGSGNHHDHGQSRQ